MPDPATEQADHIFYLWRYAWIAALITGVIVWGLIFWVVFRYRRRHDDEIPIQTRYNLPLEIFYTIAPIIMVIVFFNATVNAQNAVLEDTERGPRRQRGRPAVVVDVQLHRRRGHRRRGHQRLHQPAPPATSRRWCCRSTRRSSSTSTRPT